MERLFQMEPADVWVPITMENVWKSVEANITLRILAVLNARLLVTIALANSIVYLAILDINYIKKPNYV